MRHGMANRKLGRTSSHRKAMFRNQLASILDNERIITTLIKAKELRPIVEKMVTLGKTDSVHSRRLAALSIADNGLIQKLFSNVSPRFATRPGGYTRIIKLGPRRGDGAEMAILEFVDYSFGEGKKGAAAKGDKSAAGKKSETKEASGGKQSGEAAGKSKKSEAAATEAKPKKTSKKKAAEA